MIQYKDDNRPQRMGWASGSYINRCPKCNDGFIGDKRASECADCAYARPLPEELTKEQAWAAFDKATINFLSYAQALTKRQLMLTHPKTTISQLFECEGLLNQVRKAHDLWESKVNNNAVGTSHK